MIKIWSELPVAAEGAGRGRRDAHLGRLLGQRRLAALPIPFPFRRGWPDDPRRRRDHGPKRTNLGDALAGLPVVGSQIRDAARNAFASAGQPLSDFGTTKMNCSSWRRRHGPHQRSVGSRRACGDAHTDRGRRPSQGSPPGPQERSGRGSRAGPSSCRSPSCDEPPFLTRDSIGAGESGWIPGPATQVRPTIDTDSPAAAHVAAGTQLRNRS